MILLGESIKTLISETFNKALLDVCYTKRTCVETLLQYSLQHLSYQESKQVQVAGGKTMFKFGESEIMISFKIAQFLVDIAGVSATITTDVVAYDIPLLLSKEAMKKANTKIDFQPDEVQKYSEIELK